MVRSHPSALRFAGDLSKATLLQMLNTILSDFSRVLLSPKDSSYTGKLNRLHKELSEKNEHYPFFEHFVLNEDLLNYYKTLKPKFSLHIFTTGTVQNHPEVRKIIDPIFDTIFSAEDYSLHKNAPHAYIFIAKKLNKKPEEMLFIDDKKQNIEAAQKVGVTGVQYKDNERLFTSLQELMK